MAIEASLHLPGLPISMTQAGLVLPSQLFRPRRKGAPEQRLMIAVLQDALDCLEEHRSTTRGEGSRLFEEAKLWFLASETEWPYSFECICEVLALDANAVRERLCLAPTPQRHPGRRRPFSQDGLGAS